ncbi:MAG TPA: 4-(cytidine 5'-diphospho)-2-C-methyl-D-erythritol kinase [Aestuariivirga sp.]|nr:4-(cytidine 5'-diphospho)-2-C-methyl-D-erythritol kinase [Aestuariivirga sp.]
MPPIFTEFAPAKINLALHVLGRRADGFHEIDSIVAFAEVGDELHFETAARFSITASGPFAHLLPVSENNIIFAAWKAVARIASERAVRLPPVSVRLIKNLPVASGIGGGSADAAAAMRGFLRIAGMEKIDADVERAALSLGADVPVCLLSTACRMQGIGERITPLENFKPLAAVLVNPLIPVETSAVFQKLGLAIGAKQGMERSDLSDAKTWSNDLTPPAAVLFPAIADVIAALEKQRGLRFARMSGSGATCFGVFENLETARTAAEKILASQHWWVRKVTLA